MRFENVCLEAVVCNLPPTVVTSTEIESRLKPLYDRLGLPEGRLELMTGIHERRFFDPGTRPGAISAKTAAKALEVSGLPSEKIGALIHGSVCRDQLEPATAAGVHHRLKLSDSALVFDVSNACLGLLSGVVLLAQMIELGQIAAGIVVGTETGRSLVEGTIDRLNADTSITRKDVKSQFASLTIGSGSAAIVVCHRGISRTGLRLRGGSALADTSHHGLCAGGVSDPDFEVGGGSADHRPQMHTDAEALLEAGISVAERTWVKSRDVLGWTNQDVDKVFTHQVGRMHRIRLLEALKFPTESDFPTVEYLGNTGAAALPTALALGIEKGHFRAGETAALLGIGSGLNCLMLGLDWTDGATPAEMRIG